MSPIDEELRALFSARADGLRPAAEPFTGIERRARRIRRNRVAASVAGSALAISALAVAVPAVMSATSTRDDAPLASQGPSSAPVAPSYALDPADPWDYRGTPQDQLGTGTIETVTREYAVRRGVAEADLSLTPLFGQVWDPSGQAEVVFVATVDGEHRWGVAQGGEGGPEFPVDEALSPGTRALPFALAGDEGVGRLYVVASPQVDALQYTAGGARQWSAMTELADGVAVGPLEGDPATDRYRVLDPDGGVLVEGPAPDAPAAGPPPSGGGEGPGTDTPPDVDTAPYALDPDDPWAYRGPAEPSQHPDLAVEADRLFTGGRPDRTGGSWRQRPLLAVERPDGLSVLMVLHTKGDQAIVTTTSQRQDEAPRQSEQEVVDGQLLVQTFVPEPAGGLLIALASDRTGGVVLEQPGGARESSEPGYGVWELAPDAQPGDVLLYSEGDGLLYASEPARRS